MLGRKGIGCPLCVSASGQLEAKPRKGCPSAVRSVKDDATNRPEHSGETEFLHNARKSGEIWSAVACLRFNPARLAGRRTASDRKQPDKDVLERRAGFPARPKTAADRQGRRPLFFILTCTALRRVYLAGRHVCAKCTLLHTIGAPVLIPGRAEPSPSETEQLGFRWFMGVFHELGEFRDDIGMFVRDVV